MVQRRNARNGQRAEEGEAGEPAGMPRNGEAMLEYFGLAGQVAGEAPRDTSYTEAAVRIIRDRILDLTLAPGSRIDDGLMMDRFGMGRTPAREAFNRLSAEGLIVIQRNRGAFVRPIDIAHVQQFFDAYIASERVVGYFCRPDDPGLDEDLKAIQREYMRNYDSRHFPRMAQLNARFHARIALSSRNEYVAENAFRLYNHARRLTFFVATMEKGFIPELHETQDLIRADHDDIIAMVRRGDREALITILTRHAGLFHNRVMRAISKTRGEGAPVPVPPSYEEPAGRVSALPRPRAGRRGSG
jgi:DNA-binding GntR family transcriptional regulator